MMKLSEMNKSDRSERVTFQTNLTSDVKPAVSEKPVVAEVAPKKAKGGKKVGGWYAKT